MEDIVRRIKKAGKITSMADWQLNRMLILGKSSADLRKIVAKAVDFDAVDVNALYERVIQNEYAVYKPQYERITHKYIPYKDNLQLQQLVNAQIRNSSEDLSNVTKSMGFMLDYGGKKVFTPLSQVYNGYIDQAVTDVISGAFDYNTMLRKVCRQLSDSGLRTGRLFRSNPGDDRGIDFPSGWHNRIDVAARRALLTGVSQLSGQITAMNAERLGIDRYEVSWHAGARPDHAAWQGKVYTMEQLQKICGLGTGPGLLGWNCRHEYYLFFPGSERQYTDKWLAEQNAREARTQTFRGREYNLYQATQKQRSMETNMRAQREKVRLMQEGGADRDDIIIEQCKYQAQLDEYKEFSKKFRLPEQRDRVYADLNGRVAPSAKRYQKWKEGREERHRKWLHDIGAEDTTLNTVEKYEMAKHNKTREYVLLKGYARAVKKGDIHALTSFTVYKNTAREIDENLVGMTTVDGVEIKSYATHFIDRVIGQTSTSHKGMRLGVTVDKVRSALLKPDAIDPDEVIRNDLRRTYYGKKAIVTISIAQKRLIQVNPRGSKQ